MFPHLIKSCIIINTLLPRISCRMSSDLAMMRGIFVKEPGPPENMVLTDLPRPQLKANQVLLKVHYTAVNRADLLQRMGRYPVPRGESEIIGMEASGTIYDNNGCTKFANGQSVMALLPGGGYAQYAAVNCDHVMPVPAGLSFRDAAAIPEVWLTAFQMLHEVSDFKANHTCLIHAGASGVGTAAIQLVKLAGGRSMVTASSAKKLDLCTSLGAERVHNYKESEVDFAADASEWTGGRGVNIVLDCVGGSYWKKNTRALAIDGHWILYGLLGGGRVDGDILTAILMKRIHLRATLLRSRTDEYKTGLIKNFTRNVLPYFSKEASGSVPRLKPVIDSEFPLSNVVGAHRYVATNENLGKVLIKVHGFETESTEKSEL